jgi:phosphonate transport system permease protein
MPIPLEFVRYQKLQQRQQLIINQEWYVITIPSRFILNIVRTIPDLLLAAVFVAVFGIGQIPGVFDKNVDIVCGTTPNIIHFILFAPTAVIASIGPGSIAMEAMTAVGANKIKWIMFGVVPQTMSTFLSYVLFAFEINIEQFRNNTYC